VIKENSLKQEQHGNEQANEIYCPNDTLNRIGFKNGNTFKEKFEGKLISKQQLFLEGKSRNQNS